MAKSVRKRPSKGKVTRRKTSVGKAAAEPKKSKLPTPRKRKKPRGIVTPQFVEAGKPYRFKKGQVNNPAGRPKGVPLSSIMKTMLEEPAECIPAIAEIATELGLDPKTTTIGSTMAAKHLYDSMDAMNAREITLDRTEGKVAEHINANIRSGAMDDKSDEELLALLKSSGKENG